jgi:hypothetical protein
VSHPDERRRERNAIIAWDGMQAECVASPEPTSVGEMFGFGGEYEIEKQTRKYFYFFFEDTQERFRVERVKVQHSPKGKLHQPDKQLPASH